MKIPGMAMPKSAANISPEMIDAVMINLKMGLETMEDIPSEVKESGLAFIAALDRWTEARKAARAGVV